MACHDSVLGAKIQTSQAGLTVVSPERPLGFPVFCALQNQGAGRTAFGTGAAAGTVVVCKKDFSHKKTSYYQVEYREQRDEIQKGNRPDHLIEVISRQPERVFPEKELEIPFGFTSGPGYDTAGMPGSKSGMDGSHIYRHVKAYCAFGAVPLKEESQGREKGRQAGCSGKKKRPDVKTAPSWNTEKMGFLFPRHTEEEFYNRPGGEQSMSREGQCDQLFRRCGNFFSGLGNVNRNEFGKNIFGETGLIKPFGCPEGISGSAGEIDCSPLICSLLFFHHHAETKVSLTILYVNQGPYHSPLSKLIIDLAWN